MTTITRRKVLQGLCATTVTALVPLGLHAAKTAPAQQPIAIYIDTNHGTINNSTSNEIMNTGNRPIVLTTNEPVAYNLNQGKTVVLHVNSSERSYTLQPGERLPYYAKATLLTSQAQVKPANTLPGDSITIV